MSDYMGMVGNRPRYMDIWFTEPTQCLANSKDLRIQEFSPMTEGSSLSM